MNNLIWIIDDENVSMPETVLENKNIKKFSSIAEALNYSVSPDIILIDIGTITQSFINSKASTYAATRELLQLIDRKPGAIYGLYSAFDNYAINMAQEIIEDTDAIIEFVPFDGILNFIQKWEVEETK